MTGLVFDDFVVEDEGQLLLALTTSVPSGSTVLITGPAGTATSAVLAAIVGALTGGSASGPVTSGTVTFDRGGTDSDVDRRHLVGQVTRDHELIGALTAAENVLVGILARRRPTVEDDERIMRTLDALAVPLAARGNLVEQLSGGQQQRVAVARAIATGAPVLALDDPVSELDARTTAVVYDALADIAQSGTIVIIAAPEGTATPTSDLVIRLGSRGRHVSESPTPW